LTVKLALIGNKNLNFIKLKVLPLSDEDIKLCISKADDDKDEFFNKKLHLIDKESPLRNPL
jgi:hypothetical protein